MKKSMLVAGLLAILGVTENTYAATSQPADTTQNTSSPTPTTAGENNQAPGVSPGSSTQQPTQSGVQTPAQSGVQTPAQSGVQTPAQPGVQTPAQSGVQTPAQSGVQAPAQPGAQTPAQPGAQTPAQSGAQAPAQSGAQAPAQSGAQTPTQSGTQDSMIQPANKVVTQPDVPVLVQPVKQPVIDCNYKIPPETTNIEQSVIQTWAAKATEQSFDFDYNKINEQLSGLKSCFTEQGWKSFNDALQSSGNLKVIQSEKLMVNGMIDGDITVSTVKDNQWKVILPLQVVYQNEKEKLNQSLTITLVVGRKVSGNLGIMQMVAMPRQPATPESGATTTDSAAPTDKTTPTEKAAAQ
ncbi:DotI/IcmL family type IV secretion protein [Legionella spiritensis]|uniref:DotI/IcmL family type IV secretion protein n=1 Tax=Legionella spiritensis TaxID=452 RepID=UPI000F6C3ACB|nr:DotI/IcmL family type IV secretion protein [Legionella spiritensis]VEG92416.1 IcmL-like protein [Legionella spiritensis]